MARSEFTTACPRNCYSTCGMRVTVEDGRLLTIRAHGDNDATSEGVCLKGQSYVERVYAADRLLYPLKRTGTGFQRIGWDEALDTIAARLRDCRDRWGPQSVLYIPAGVAHHYEVTEAPFEFLCMVPNAEDRIELVDEDS